MKKILILMGRYLPGHKDGGPLRTIINLTDALGDDYQFYIACYDRDHGDTESYPNIQYGKWNKVGKAKVCYIKPRGFSFNVIKKLAKGKDSIYLTSFYDDYGYKTLMLKRLGVIKQPVALASMGVFSESALSQKSIKKKAFIALCKALRLFKNIEWSVTSELEAKDLKKAIDNNVSYTIAEDLPRSTIPGRVHKDHDKIRIVFLSRICEHKGLDIGISAIKGMKHECVFDIFGPIQEPDYWEKCRKMLVNSDVEWHYGGDVPSEKVQQVLSQEDILILPSKSENYGHVIFEALSVGCIPVISDTTPWVDLAEKKAGIIAKRNSSDFTKALDLLSGITQNERLLISENCIIYARERVRKAIKGTGYTRIFSL